MDEADALTRCGRNLAAYLRHLAVNAKGGGVDDADGLLCFAGAHPYPGTHTNGIIRTTTELPGDLALARAKAFFAPRRRSFTIWIRDDVDADLEAACQAAGYELRPPAEGMPTTSIDHPLDESVSPLHPDATLVRVSDDVTAQHYLQIVGEGFGMSVPLPVLEQTFFSLASLKDDRVHAFVAYLGDDPVSGCMSFVDGEYAGLYSGATLERARGKKLAPACLRTATNSGFAVGARYAGGQSAEMGHPTWSRMGFQTLAHFRRYIGKP